MDAGFDGALFRDVVEALKGGPWMIAHGLPVYLALEPVDMRFGYERSAASCERACRRSRALVFVGKRGRTMKVLTWDGTGAIVVHEKRDVGKFELPKPTRVGDQHLIVSDAIFEVIDKGIPVAPKKPPRRRPARRNRVG